MGNSLHIEVINTGSELLLGHVTNTHLGFLARELFGLGMRIDRQVTVPDGPDIRAALTEALTRADLIFVTGGLGPTSDDITRDVVAELLHRPLHHNAEVEAKILARFAARKIIPSASVRVQSMVPEGALVLANDWGTAPGLLLEDGKKVIVLLPGPPRELIPMWHARVVPWLQANRVQEPVHLRTWRVVGIGESSVADLLEEPLRAVAPFEFGYCARPGEVDFRLITSDPQFFAPADQMIREQLGDAVFALDAETMEEVVIRLSRESNRTVATAESCTGGLVAHRLTNVPGSSEAFRFGWVTYANEAKTKQLGVPAEVIAKHGAVSEPVVRAMAEGARRESGADFAVAVSGIAGPGGGTAEKPVGFVWLAVSGPAGTHAVSRQLSNDRETFKNMASQTALDLLRRSLSGATLPA